MTDMWSFINVFFNCAFLVSFPLPLSCTVSHLETMSPLRFELHLRIESWQTDFSCAGNYWRLFLFAIWGHCITLKHETSKALGATCLEWARQTCPELATLLALGPSPCLQDVQDVLAPAPQRDKYDMTSGFQVEALLISIFGLRSFGFSSKTVSSDGARSRTNAFIHNSGRAQSHEVANWTQTMSTCKKNKHK